MRIYTCLVNSFDLLKPLPDGLAGVCYTDDPDLSARGWEIRPLEFPGGAARQIVWRHKWASHVLFPGEPTLWVDAAYALSKLPPVSECAMFGHYNESVKRIADEIEYTTRCHRWLGPQDCAAAKAALARYEAAGFSDSGPHAETGFMVRRDTPKVRALNEVMLAECGMAGDRDQTVFDYAAWKAKAAWTRLPGTSKANGFATLFADGHARPARPRIYFFTPYDKRGLGYAYNECCALVPDDAWVCLVDADVMLFPSNFGDLIADAIQQNPGYDVYVTRATRAGAEPEKWTIGKGVAEETNIVRVREAIMEWQSANAGIVRPFRSDIIGHVIIFRKRLWNEIPFPTVGHELANCWTPGGRHSRVLGIDTEWTARLKGKRIGMIEGLVACHYYRLGLNETQHRRWLEANTDAGETVIMPTGDTKVHYFVPYSRDGLGKAYNDACRLVPKGEWVCLMDADVMLFPSAFGDEVVRAITADPKVDVWTTMVTRVNCNKGALCPSGAHDKERDLAVLADKSREWAREHTGKTRRLNARTLAGYFMLFRRELWDTHPFPEDSGKVINVDLTWTRALHEAGKIFGVIEGLLAVHYYSLGESRSRHIRELDSKYAPAPRPVPAPGSPAMPMRRKIVRLA